MPKRHLTQECLDDAVQLILDNVGYDSATRNALLAGISKRFVAGLPGGPAPIAALMLDLTRLNEVERLTDGTVPIKMFLQNALRLAGMVADLDPLRAALADIDANTSGAPRVDTRALPEIAEKIIFQDDMVPFDFMTRGVECAQSVVKLEVPRFEGGRPIMNGAAPVIYLGTGWYIAPGLLITNFHVINARNEGEATVSAADLDLQVGSAVAKFDYNDTSVASLAKKPRALLAWNVELDYALLRIDEQRPALRIAAAAIVAPSPSKPVAVNIIQHPEGGIKKFGIRNNLVTAVTHTDVRYFTDTMGGSSGSPVFDDRWQVVALHRGSSFVRGVTFQGRDVAYVNVGTKIQCILSDLEARYAAVRAEISV